MLAGKRIAGLVALRVSISNGALKAEKLPSRLKVLGWGASETTKGTVRLNEVSADKLLRNQKDSGFEKIALDFEHNTVPGSEEYERTKEPRSVAAYGTVNLVPGEGLFLEDIEWTPEGQSAALNFADLSPAVKFDESGNIIFVHSVALTRNGAVHGLSFFSSGPNGETQMDNNIKPENMITVAEMAPALGLAATASKADVLGKLVAFAALCAAVTVKDNKIEALSAIESRVKTIEEAGNRAIATLSATIDGKVVTLHAEDLAKLGARVESLEDRLVKAELDRLAQQRADLVARFSAEGKVPRGTDGKELSAEALSKLDVPSLQLLHANTASTVPMSSRGRVREGQKRDDLKGLARAIAAHQAES